MRGLGVIAALALAAGALAAGCGDDDDETTTTGATGATGAAGVELSESEYLASANEVCKTGAREIDQAAEETFSGGGRPSDAEIEEFATDTAIPSLQGQIDEISALTPPEDQAAEFESFVDDVQAAVDELEADPLLVTEESAKDPFADVNKQAEELGLDQCK